MHFHTESVTVKIDAGRRGRFTSSSSNASMDYPSGFSRVRRNTKPSVDVHGLRPPGFFRHIAVRPQGNTRNEHEESKCPLLKAYRGKDYDSVEKLAASCDLYSPVSGGQTLADVAAADGDLHTLEILDNCHYKFNKKNSLHYVPLHYAVESKQVKAVRKLVSLGADISIPLPSGEYVLHRACSLPDTSVLSCLLNKCKAEVDVTDRQNNTALHRACLEDSVSHVEVLLKYCSEAIVNYRGYEGKTPLHIAVINQNRKITNMLLHKGAFIDIQSDSKKTVIDQILSLGSVVMMSDLAHFFTEEMTKSKAKSFADLFQDDQFTQYLNFLDAVDNEYQVCEVNYDILGEEEEKELLSKLEKDDKIDMIEFKEVILKLLQTEVIHILADPVNYDVLLKTCANVVRYVLYREDAVMLQRITSCGVVWWEIRTRIEAHIEELYVHSPNRGFNGILVHLIKNFISDHKLDRTGFVNFYNQRCGNFLMRPKRQVEFHMQTDYMRHPMDTLVMWSVFTGRTKLTETLLRQEKFDVVPLALYCAAALRAFVDISDVAVDAEEMENLANRFELFAAQISESVHQLDSSFAKQVSVNYMLMKLPTYGEVSCIQLAAKNNSAKFLQTVIGQEALNKRWYGRLLHVQPMIRIVIIWLGITPLAIFIPAILIHIEEKLLFEERKKASVLDYDSSKKRKDKCTFLLSEASRSSSPDDSADGDNSRAHSPSRAAQQSLKQLGSAIQGNKGSSVSLPGQLEARSLENLEKDRSRRFPACCSFSKVKQLVKLLCEFYNIPAVKFCYHAVSHIILLLLLSYIILLDLEYEISVAEVAAYCILFGFLAEEIKEFSQNQMQRATIGNFFESKWNVIDLLALLSAVIGFCLRMSRLSWSSSTTEKSLLMDFDDKIWYSARLFLGTTCMLYWVRLLYISTVLETLGPKLKMIAKMIIKDMMPFLFILFIFILGFGVLIHGLLFPNGHKAWNVEKMSTQEVLVTMFRICFYSMVGEYSLDAIDGPSSCDSIYSNKTLNSEACPHQYGRFLVPNLVMPLYVITTEILLLNLIIALFSKTIEEIDSRSKSLWQFERHELIEEFESRSCLPPPFNLIDILRRIIQRLIHSVDGFRYANQSFDKRGVLEYLLYQAFSLRNNRGRLMEGGSPRCDETEDLLWNIRSIVRQELENQRKMPADEDRGKNVKDRIDAVEGTLMESTPKPKQEREPPSNAFTALMEEEIENFEQI